MPRSSSWTNRTVPDERQVRQNCPVLRLQFAPHRCPIATIVSQLPSKYVTEPKRAYDRAILYGNAAREKDSEALIGLVSGLPIERERKVAIERLLAPPQTELALGV